MRETNQSEGFLNVSDSSTLAVAGETAILAARYVEALFELAEQKGALDAVLADLATLKGLWKDSPEWRFIASDPRLGAEDAEKAVAKVGAAAKLHKLTANFLAVLAQNHRLALLPLLIEKFFDSASAKRGEFRADVRVARPLSEAQRDKLTALLSSAVKGTVRLSMIDDPSIIGGLTVKVGSQFIDASVKTKLDLLERKLKTEKEAV